MVTSCKGLMPYPGLLHLEPLWQATADPHLHRRRSDMFLAQCLWVGRAFCAVPRSERLRRPGACEGTVPGGPYILITFWVQTTVSWVCRRALSQVCSMSPLESYSQTATLLADVIHPGSQEDLVSSWEPAHSWWKMLSLRL